VVDSGGGGLDLAQGKEECSFLKKKNQKTSIRLRRAYRIHAAQMDEVFFASFFFRKKKTLSYSPPPNPCT
jgi:hypothetical protein